VLWKAIERVIPDIRQRVDVAQVGKKKSAKAKKNEKKKSARLQSETR
jgi:hypothetical protein